MNDDGELLISPDVSEGVLNQTISFCGIDGWLYRADELDYVCDRLYTVEGKGKALSWNMEDVIRVLGYSGEMGGYVPKNSSNSLVVHTLEALKISVLANQIGYDMDDFASLAPEKGKNIGDYKSDGCYFSTRNQNHLENMKYADNIEYIVTNGDYWLASPCVIADFSDDSAGFGLQFIQSWQSAITTFYDSHSASAPFEHSFRPLVSIKAQIQRSKENENEWNFVE